MFIKKQVCQPCNHVKIREPPTVFCTVSPNSSLCCKKAFIRENLHVNLGGSSLFSRAKLALSRIRRYQIYTPTPAKSDETTRTGRATCPRIQLTQFPASITIFNGRLVSTFILNLRGARALRAPKPPHTDNSICRFRTRTYPWDLKLNVQHVFVLLHLLSGKDLSKDNFPVLGRVYWHSGID